MAVGGGSWGRLGQGEKIAGRIGGRGWGVDEMACSYYIEKYGSVSGGEVSKEEEQPTVKNSSRNRNSMLNPDLGMEGYLGNYHEVEFRGENGCWNFCVVGHYGLIPLVVVRAVMKKRLGGGGPSTLRPEYYQH
jgi:hypothetical protein